MSELCGLDLPATLIFDHPSVSAIAGYVVSKLPSMQAAQPAAASRAPVAAGAHGARGLAAMQRGRQHQQQLVRKAVTRVQAAPAALSKAQQLERASTMVRATLLLGLHHQVYAAAAAADTHLTLAPPRLTPMLQVHAAVAKVLGGVEVAASTPLMTAGLDSLGAVELRKELSRCGAA